MIWKFRKAIRAPRFGGDIWFCVFEPSVAINNCPALVSVGIGLKRDVAIQDARDELEKLVRVKLKPETYNRQIASINRRKLNFIGVK